jgi:hypothetical protein
VAVPGARCAISIVAEEDHFAVLTGSGWPFEWTAESLVQADDDTSGAAADGADAARAGARPRAGTPPPACRSGASGAGAALLDARRRFSLPSDATAGAAGFEHACAVRRDGRVVCWGNNQHGEVAVSPPFVRRPVDVIGLDARGGSRPR